MHLDSGFAWLWCDADDITDDGDEHAVIFVGHAECVMMG